MAPIYAGIHTEETGERIRSLMEENGYTVRDIQDAMGFEHPQAVYKWLNGDAIPKVDNLIILSILFHKSINEILAYGGDFDFYVNYLAGRMFIGLSGFFS